MAVLSLLVHRVTSSPWGRVIRSIREDQDAARSLGKNSFAYKLQRLVLGGRDGRAGGDDAGVDYQSVSPGYYLPAITFSVYAVVILGGPGSVRGPIVGAIVFWFLLQFCAGILTDAIASGWIPSSVLSTNDVLTFRFVRHRQRTAARPQGDRAVPGHARGRPLSPPRRRRPTARTAGRSR